jgi:hypothetical protein
MAVYLRTFSGALLVSTYSDHLASCVYTVTLRFTNEI